MLDTELDTEKEVADAMINMNTNIAKQVKREKNLELLEKLTHKHRGRGFWRCFGYEELQQAREILQGVIEETKSEYIEQQARKKEAESLREQVETMLQQKGFSSSDLFGSQDIQGPIRKTRKLRSPSKIKYMVRVFGTDFYWTGLGQIPLSFRYAYKVNGTHKSDYLLPEPLDNSEQYKTKKIPIEYMEECKRILNNG